MAILTPSWAQPPTATINDREVILISDDESDDSDDDCEFEDVIGVDVAANMVEHTGVKSEEDNADDRANDDEANDDEATHDEATHGEATHGEATHGEATHDEATHGDVSNDAWSDSGANDALTPGAGSARKIGDEHVTTATTPHDGVAVEADGSLHDDGEEASTTQLVDLDTHNDNDTLGASDTIVNAENVLGPIVAELAALRHRVTQIEGRLHVGSVTCQATTPSKKRKRKNSPSPRPRKTERKSTVNISASRAYVHWHDTSERFEYTWSRGRGGRCWVRDEGLEGREEVDGEYLLCCAFNMSIEVRANADWLPIEVRLNEDRNVFEGLASVGRCRLEVEDSVMMDMMCGGKGERVASVFYD